MFFMGRKKATVRNKQTLIDALHTTDLQREKTGLARKLIGLLLQMVTWLQDIMSSREMSVRWGRISVRKGCRGIWNSTVNSRGHESSGICRFMSWNVIRCVDNVLKRKRKYCRISR